MLIFIIIYLVLGVILTLNGPLKDSLVNSISEFTFDQSKYFIIRNSLFIFSIFLVGVLLYPIFYYSYFFENGKKQHEILKFSKYDKSKLYFNKTRGVGMIVCNRCNYKERIISLTLGFDKELGYEYGKAGFQCEKCGKFDIKIGVKGKTEVKNCECGGTLQRYRPLFCPKCKSYKLKFEFETTLNN